VRRRRIGKRIRDARLHADLTQERLGELVDLSRNTIVNIETGVHSPRLDSLLMIADAVRVPLDELIRE
jgi:transcriptional regulator with XRE-family HTH domain